MYELYESKPDPRASITLFLALSRFTYVNGHKAQSSNENERIMKIRSDGKHHQRLFDLRNFYILY